MSLFWHEKFESIVCNDSGIRMEHVGLCITECDSCKTSPLPRQQLPTVWGEQCRARLFQPMDNCSPPRDVSIDGFDERFSRWSWPSVKFDRVSNRPRIGLKMRQGRRNLAKKPD